MNPRQAIRQKCLDCCNEARKVVKYCPCDGVNSTACPLWPHRFGLTVATAIKRHGNQFLSPKDMPDPNIPVEDLP